jgi:integrase
MKLSIEVNFKLKSQPLANGNKLIIATAYFNNECLTISTGLNVSPGNWNHQAGMLAESIAGTQEGKKIARRLAAIAGNVKQAYHIVSDHSAHVTKQAVKQRYEEITGKKKKGGFTFLQCIDLFIEKAKSGELKTRNGRPYGQSIIFIYERAKVYLLEYSKRHLGKQAPDFADVLNNDFYGKFTRFLQREKFKRTTKGGKDVAYGGLNPNSISSIITRIKTFLNASKEHYTTRFDYAAHFKTPSRAQKKVYLTIEELAIIERMDLSENVIMNQVRDWLLIACWTGLRVSDFKRLRPEHIDLKKNLISIDAQKTGQASYIPIFQPVANILKRYKANGEFLPRPFSDQYLNRAFKLLAEKAGVDQPVITTTYQGSKMIEVTEPKHQHIFTKTGRTSFISNLLKLGFSREQISMMTGHKSERVFHGYNQLSGESNAEAVLIEFRKRSATMTAV